MRSVIAAVRRVEKLIGPLDRPLSLLTLLKRRRLPEPFSVLDFLLHPVPEICQFAPGEDGVRRQGLMILPGGKQPVQVPYYVYGDTAVMEGGVVLGSADQVEHHVDKVAEILQSDTSDDEADHDIEGESVTSRLLALSSADALWDGIVPYQIDILNQTLRDRISWAVQYFNLNTNLRWVAASDSFRTKVVFGFSDDPNASSAHLGRRLTPLSGGVTPILLNEFFDCGGILHEMLHACGILHEQSRNDRDAFVEILTDNISPKRLDEFEKRVGGTTDLGPYDYDSVMHYSATAFGLPNPNAPGTPLLTIRPRMAGISPDRLGSARHTTGMSTGDIQALNRLYRVQREFDGGALWQEQASTTALCFADVDGDGFEELVVGRRSRDGERYFILDDSQHDYNALLPRAGDDRSEIAGRSWGRGFLTTCCAAGDIDGDGRDEIVIGRQASEGPRLEIIDDAAAGFAQLATIGSEWGRRFHPTGVAVGIDGDGTPLIAVSRWADGSHPRILIYTWDQSAQKCEQIFEGGLSWPSRYYATAIALGDVDGDDRLEVGFTRFADREGRARWAILNSRDGDFAEIHSGGTGWGRDYFGTAISFGDVDGDGRDEIGVSRFAREGARWFVFDDFQSQFAGLHEGGSGWGPRYFATSIALGDLDGDDLAEVAVARQADRNSRYLVFDDQRHNFELLARGGHAWSNAFWAPTITIGGGRIVPSLASNPSRSRRNRNFAVGRAADKNERFQVHRLDDGTRSVPVIPHYPGASGAPAGSTPPSTVPC